MKTRPSDYVRAMTMLLGVLAFSTAASQESVVQQFSGNGALNTRPFTVAQGSEVQWHASGDIFQLYLHDGAGSLVDVAANQLGPGPGASYIPTPGTYYLQVNAIGSWSIRIVEIAGAPPQVGASPHVIDGNGVRNTRPFVVAGPWEIQWNSTGDIIQIFLYDGLGQLVDIAANQLGAGTGASYQPRPGTFYLQINGVGNWTVRIVSLN